jgi:hypothetical protein
MVIHTLCQFQETSGHVTLTFWEFQTMNIGEGNIMTGLNREQLEAFRRQVEEDYRLDMAAIERLQRRFSGQDTNIPSTPTSSFSLGNNGPVIATHVSALPAIEALAPSQPDELTGTLRTMFSTLR